MGNYYRTTLGGDVMSQTQPSQKKKVHVKAGMKSLFSVAALAIGILIAFTVLFLGGPFEAPAPPPEEFATGYYRIYLTDGFDREYVQCDEIYLLDAYTHQIHATNISTGITYYTATASLFWCNLSGYYPVAGTLYANQGDNPSEYLNNSRNIFRRADPSDITVTLVRWIDLSTSIANYSQALPSYDGYFQFEITCTINEHARYNSSFGIKEWIPMSLIPEDSFAYNLSMNIYSLFIGFDASVANYTSLDLYWDYNDVYSINIMNVTMHPPIFYEKTYIFKGYFSGLSQIVIWDRLIDDYTEPLAVLT